MVAAAGNRTFQVKVCCKRCCVDHVVLVNYNDYFDWATGKGLIQNMLPYLSADEREILISEICGPCFDKMFGSAS